MSLNPHMLRGKEWFCDCEYLHNNSISYTSSLPATPFLITNASMAQSTEITSLSSFTHLQLLPQELQNMIWKHTLKPQLITVHFSGNHSFSNPLPAAEGFSAVSTKSPLAFSMCRASRFVAQNSKAYKKWPLVNREGKAGYVLWNPQIDTVHIIGNPDPLIHPDPLIKPNGYLSNYFSAVFFKFSSEVMSIRNLALSYDFLESFKTQPENETRSTIPARHSLLYMLTNSKQLQQIFIMVDQDFFEREVEGRNTDQLEFWNKEGGMGKGLYTALRLYRSVAPQQRSPNAKVRFSVASNFEMIMRGKDVECLDFSTATHVT